MRIKTYRENFKYFGQCEHCYCSFYCHEEETTLEKTSKKRGCKCPKCGKWVAVSKSADIKPIDMIPVDVYCDRCPFWHELIHHQRRRDLCQFGDVCEDEKCEDCDQPVSFCEYLGYIEYGQYPLGDMCKICGIKDEYAEEKI